MLYRNDEHETALVIKCEDDDELIYLLRKLERTRVKWLRGFAKSLIEDFFVKSTMEEVAPPVLEISTKNDTTN